METEHSSKMVTLHYGALTYAAEVLVTLLAFVVVKATLLAPKLYELMLTNMPSTKGESKPQVKTSNSMLKEKMKLSSEDGGGYGNISNNKSNSKKAPEGGAGGADENGEEEDNGDNP